MKDATTVHEVETIYVRKFADDAARARNMASEVIKLEQITVDGVAAEPTIETVCSDSQDFEIMDAAAIEAEERARSGG